MSLPETIRVKLSSEAAGTISLTPVVAREMPLRELIERMLGVTGKDAPRVRELLLRGSLVQGASRFRWTGWEADLGAVEALLATFPDPEPSRPFAAERCVHAVLRGPGRAVEIPREVGMRRGLFRRSSFWDALMRVAGEARPRYLDYSYKEQADRYSLVLDAEAAARVRSAAGLIRYSAVEEQVRAAPIESLELHVRRG